MATKEYNKLLVRDLFFKLGQIVDKSNAAQNAYRSRMAELEAQRNTYLPEHIQKGQDEANSELKVKTQALFQDCQIQLDKLGSALIEMHSQFDLGNPALTNALKLIEISGKNLSYANVAGIIAQFPDDQASMRQLQTALKARDIIDGGLDKLIYNAGEAIDTLKQYASWVVAGKESTFIFGVQVGKIAKLENIDFPQGEPFPSFVGKPSMDDPSVARAAAGLPPIHPAGK